MTGGYGDVRPVGVIARRLTITGAVVGRSYLAILLELFVGIDNAQRSSDVP
jgi:hypothetical protein